MARDNRSHRHVSSVKANFVAELCRKSLSQTFWPTELMCTVTFIARDRGYALGMNRDEKLTRPTALPPARHTLGTRQAIFPTEPNGGTWIGVNDAAVTFALINWYLVPARVTRQHVSRGNVVRACLDAASPDAAARILKAFPLKRVNPFRLIGIFPASRLVLEWRWNLKRLDPIEHPWETNIWISSGFDDLGAQQTRAKTFRNALQTRAPTIQWLRRLHSSHEPESGPYSICMHRHDARTVSYTEVRLTLENVTMCYRPDAPCVESPDRSAPLSEAKVTFGLPDSTEHRIAASTNTDIPVKRVGSS
jgi:hypothetical protein